MAAPVPTQTPPRRGRRALLALAALLVLAGAAIAAVTLLGRGDDKQTASSNQSLVPNTRAEGRGFGPLAYSSAKNAAFERRAAAGFAHPLYTEPLGGAAASATRTERWRPQIEAAATKAGIDADTLAALVYLESAGRPDAMAGPDPRSAAGLTQILPETARNLLGMHVNLAESVQLTKRLVKAQRKAQPALAARLVTQRRRVDDRFDPVKALDGTATYLRKSRDEFPREDLAVEAYHMGIGNLHDALDAYGATDIPYAQLYFDSSPARHAAAYQKLFQLSDDSATYWFRILAAKEILRLARENPGELRRRAELETQKNSSENLMHPPDDGEAFGTAADIQAAERSGDLLRLNSLKLARAGVKIDPKMGELAPQLGQKPSRYRALRPEALATLGYVAAGRTRVRGRPREADRHQHGPGQRLPAPAARPEPRGDAELLAPHDRLRVRHLAQVRQPQAGLRLPVLPQPPPGAGPDRLGARAGRDPRDRVPRRRRARARAAKAWAPLGRPEEPCDFRGAGRMPAASILRTMDAIRTPDELLEGLPDFPFPPHYRQADGLRLAHIDEGDGPPVVFLHGEPTWSFLWRKVIPPVRDAGFRCLAPDLPGFGRSDKPTDIDWYSYDRHTAAVEQFLEDLDIRDATLVVHDWGGAIGMRVAIDHPERVARFVIMDTGLFTGYQGMSDAWKAFRDFVARTEDLPIGFLVRGACHADPADDVIAAYDAPFPSVASKAGARAFPLMLPTAPNDAGRGGGSARARGHGPRPPAHADAVGRLGHRPAARRGQPLRRDDRPRQAHARPRAPRTSSRRTRASRSASEIAAWLTA